MNILIVSPKFHPVIGGGETYVLNSARKLAQLGHQVSIAAEQNDERQLNSYPFEVFELGGLSDINLNINEVVVELAGLISKLSPDVIHVHGYFALLAVGLCNEKNIPIVASIHSTPVWNERIVGNMHSFSAELTFARAVLDAAKPIVLTAANEVYADAAKKIADGRLPVTLLPYPVDLDFFYTETDRSMRAELGLSESDTLLVLPSRIIERKGIKEGVFSLEMLPEDTYLCIPAAVEPLDKAYWNEILDSESYKRVQHRIKIPSAKLLYDDMPKLYAASDIVIMPSYYEGAPVATVEAMTSGKPFIGANAQGINGFIRHEQNGLLVPQKSVRELAGAVARLMSDPALGSRIAVRARSDVAYLGWDPQIKVLLDAYKTALRAKVRLLDPKLILSEAK